MYLKVHKFPGGEIVALCDADLLGQVLSDSKRHLDLCAHANFYNGKKVDRKAAVSALRGAINVNLVGKKSLAAAKSAGFRATKAQRIAGVPHLQIYSIA